MARSKLKYTRAELTRTALLFAGDLETKSTCHICGHWWWTDGPTEHSAECPLGDPGVTGLMMVKLRPQIEFMARPGCAAHQRLWWKGPSGAEYYITRLPGTCGCPHGRVSMNGRLHNEVLVAGDLGALKRKIRENLHDY